MDFIDWLQTVDRIDPRPVPAVKAKALPVGAKAEALEAPQLRVPAAQQPTRTGIPKLYNALRFAGWCQESKTQGEEFAVGA